LYPEKSQIDNFFHTSSCESIIETIKSYKQQFVVIDSIQTITTQTNDASPGSPAQVRSCSELLTDLAKQYGVTMLIIGHVTKGGEIAGPKYLEHIVDVVLYLEGDRTGDMRFLRNYKNRFGHADGTGIFGMTGQ
jgi:DNA repair protein RadA/Sms